MRWIIASLGALLVAATIARAQPDSTAVQQAGFTMKKSPSTAILYSLAFPGAGQIYTETYWKAPLFAGAAGILIYGIIANQSSFSERSDAADAAVAAGKSAVEISLLRRQREFYRDQRDLSGFFLLATYLVAAVDAYAGTHLYDFNVSDKLSVRLLPDATRNGVMLAVSW